MITAKDFLNYVILVFGDTTFSMYHYKIGYEYYDLDMEWNLSWYTSHSAVDQLFKLEKTAIYIAIGKAIDSTVIILKSNGDIRQEKSIFDVKEVTI